MLSQFKYSLKERFPPLVRLWRRMKYHKVVVGSPDKLFTDIYRDNKWGNAESRSGSGSSLAQTEAVRQALPSLIEELGCRSLLDVPCGDFNWMKLLSLDVDYTGGDIVAELVESNQALYGNSRRRFLRIDLLRDRLPAADLMLCRDCLIHFSNTDAMRALSRIKESGVVYLLTTFYADRTENEDIPTGYMRPLNLTLPPFNFPPPLRIIDERCPRPDFPDKQLGLWRVADLPGYATGRR
jgi:hypothetical protein